MDANLYFYKEVIEKYGVDKMLIPVNLGNGELENVILSDLRKALDLCYAEIGNYITFKELFLDYLEDYLIDLRAINIPTQKRVFKKIQRKIKVLEKRHPNLDYNNKNDEVIIDEISNLTWKLEQEKHIFHYLKELPFFIRIWTTEKRKEYNDEYLKNYINREDNKSTLKNFLKKRKQNKFIKKPLPFYCQVEALFAQGFISKKSLNITIRMTITTKILRA